MLRRGSSFFRKELAGSYAFAITIAAVLLSAYVDRECFAWSFVQLVRSLWPARLAHVLPASVLDMERWAWASWRTKYLSASHVNGALPILEFTPTTIARTAPPLDVPWVVRGYLNGTRLHAKWTTEWLSESPGRGDTMVDYFSNATLPLLVPDARAPLKDVLANISGGGPQKLGTEMVFRAEPSIVADLAELTLLSKLGSHYFRPAMLGTILTMPLFAARGFVRDTTRTDLHCEPIANAVLMLSGEKRWTFVGPESSHLLNPQVSPDGRAYYYAQLPHASEDFGLLVRKQIVTRAGDLLFVPTWTWHRVDYLPDSVAVAVSLFHFRPKDFVTNNPLYAMLLLPNLVKELFGLKKQ